MVLSEPSEYMNAFMSLSSKEKEAENTSKYHSKMINDEYRNIEAENWCGK